MTAMRANIEPPGVATGDQGTHGGLPRKKSGASSGSPVSGKSIGSGI
jgi:hypothetical protein